MPKSRQLIYAAGGEIDSGEFALDISSDDLQPADISSLLGLRPTSHHVRGDTIGKGGRAYKFGRWRYATTRLDFRTGPSFEVQFDDFVRALPDDPSIWEYITAQHQAGILIYLWMRTWNREFDISMFAIGELARRRLRVHIDTYLDANDESAQTA